MVNKLIRADLELFSSNESPQSPTGSDVTAEEMMVQHTNWPGSSQSAVRDPEITISLRNHDQFLLSDAGETGSPSSP